MLVLGLLTGQGCDSVLPGDTGTLIIEAYLDVGKPLPEIRVFLAAPLSSDRFQDQEGITDADVRLTLDGREYVYEPTPTKPGIYRSAGPSSDLVPPGVSYELVIEARSQRAFAIGLTPLPVAISNVSVRVSSTPVAAVLLDSLDLGLDSLNLGLDTRTGFIYPVEVSIDWPAEANLTDDSWIETRLEPITEFSSTIVDFFLLPSDIFPEGTASVNDSGGRTWKGVYAVPVEVESNPMPDHTLRVALLRGTQAYARYASSRLDPVNREPISNLTGAVGYVGGISIDSVRVSVTKQ